MSRLFDALRQSELERSGSTPPGEAGPTLSSDLFHAIESDPYRFEQVRSLQPVVRPHSRLVALSDKRGLGAEKFQLLATRLKYLQEQGNVKKILVTSCVAKEGKSFVAANLAITLAQGTRQRILLLEGDLRQPVLSSLMGLNGLRGLSEWLQGKEPITKFFCRVSELQLWFLPAGASAQHPLELLRAGQLSDLLTQFTRWFDWVVIDSPPILPLADANIWAQLSDGLLLVVRQGQTPKKLVQKALENLDNPTLLGVVLNEATGEDHRYYGRYSAPRPAGKNSKSRQSKTEVSS